jgi:hypothetical protein
MTGQSLNCGRCAAFSRELRQLEKRLHPDGVAELPKSVTARSRGSNAYVTGRFALAKYAAALRFFALVIGRRLNHGSAADMSGIEQV